MINQYRKLQVRVLEISTQVCRYSYTSDFMPRGIDRTTQTWKEKIHKKNLEAITRTPHWPPISILLVDVINCTKYCYRMFAGRRGRHLDVPRKTALLGRGTLKLNGAVRANHVCFLPTSHQAPTPRGEERPFLHNRDSGRCYRTHARCGPPLAQKQKKRHGRSREGADWPCLLAGHAAIVSPAHAPF